MTTYFLDPSAVTNGSGTPASPKNTLSGVALAAGDTVSIKRGTTYNGTLTVPSGGNFTLNAYYNSDGTDNRQLPRATLNLGATVMTTYGTPRDGVTISNVNITNIMGGSAAADTPVIYLGNSCSISNSKFDSDCGGISIFKKSDVKLTNVEVSAVSTAFSNNGISIIQDGTVDMNNIFLQDVTVYHKGGGTVSGSKGIRVESFNTTNVITNLKLKNVKVVPYGDTGANAVVTLTTNTGRVANVGAHGIWISGAPGVLLDQCSVYRMLTGLFLSGLSGAKVLRSQFSDNYNFGVHITIETHGILLEDLTCNYNGTALEQASPLIHAYGRGIEMSAGGAANSGKCSGHIVRRCDCSYNYNFGGPSDNGSEGVGLGLDDTTVSCLAYGNTFRYNEGNGVQIYGGTSPAESGGNTVVGNLFMSNCLASYQSRRTGGALATTFNAHVGSAANVGRATTIAHNLFVGSTKAGVSVASTSSNVIIANNIFEDVQYPVCAAANTFAAFNNCFHTKTTTVRKYSDVTAPGGVPSFPSLAYTGTNDFTFDPLLDSNYKLLAGSPCIGAGLFAGHFTDLAGRSFKLPPSIGPYENYVALARAPRA